MIGIAIFLLLMIFTLCLLLKLNSKPDFNLDEDIQARRDKDREKQDNLLHTPVDDI